MQPTRQRYLMMLLSASICGCSLGPSVTENKQRSQQDIVHKVGSPHPSFIELDVRQLQVSELQAGQKVHLVTGSRTESRLTEINTSCTQVAGTVVSVDDQRVVVRDAVKITQASRMTGTPILNKIPYFSRLFRNSGVARESVAIPGEVSIARSEILLAGELSNSGAETLNQGQQFERIGIDFDFDVGRTGISAR